jgi:hypothetical protein
MGDKASKAELEELVTSYATAVLAFNGASSILILAMAEQALPSDEDIAAEKEARANVESARARLWAEYAKK